MKFHIKNIKIKEKLQELSKIAKYAYLTTRLVSKGNKLIFIGTLVENVLVVVFPLVNAFIYKDIIDLIVQYIQHKGTILPALYYLFALRLAMAFLQTFASSVDTILMKAIYKITEREFDHVILSKYAQMDVQLFENPKLKDYYDKIDDNRWRAKEFINETISLFQSFMQMVLSLISVIIVLPVIILLALLATLPSLFIDMKYSKIAWGLWDARKDDRKKYWYNSHLLSARETRKEITLFQMGDKLVKETYKILSAIATSDMKLAKKTFFVNLPFIFLNGILYTGVEIFLVVQTIMGKITLGSLSYVTSILAQFTNGVNSFIKTFTRMYDHSLYMESMFDFLKIENVIEEKENPVVMDPSKPHSIEFRDVSFTYPETEHQIFKNFSIKIEPGEKVAFVGENGAGKTTLIKLLVRFYDPDEGEILIDGINLKELEIDSWQKCIGILFQDFLKYEMSVRDNIQAGKMHDIKEEIDDIVDASKKSSAHPFIELFPNQYEQMLGRTYDNSVEISGGQWQKMALARGFLRDASILVLDEPTASIDARAEFEIFQKIEQLQKEKTVIIISHRFSTVRNAQKIYVIDKGKIIEQGSHKELMKINGIYAELFNLQAEGYK